MMKPIIGVTPSFSANERNYTIAETYIESIKKAGGIPVVLPHTPGDAVQIAQVFDALLVSGGPDLDPIYFGELPHPRLGRIDPERDESEIALIKAFLETGKPILGICRGEQVLNVVCGGTLYQDLGSEYTGGALIKHNQEAPRWHTSHCATVVSGSRLAGIFNEENIEINSFHHQAVKDLAPCFIISVTSPDGVIEAYENPNHKFCVGIQWHPECMFERTTRSDKLFAAFVAACCE